MIEGVQLLVAPFTGAWIEITPSTVSLTLAFVAPFTGAWIEMTMPLVVT